MHPFSHFKPSMYIVESDLKMSVVRYFKYRIIFYIEMSPCMLQLIILKPYNDIQKQKGTLIICISM